MKRKGFDFLEKFVLRHQKLCTSITMVDLHSYFIEVGQLPGIHMLVVSNLHSYICIWFSYFYIQFELLSYMHVVDVYSIFQEIHIKHKFRLMHLI